MSPTPKPFAPTLTARINDVATRCRARLARPQRPAEVRAALVQLRVDAAAQAQAREGSR